MTDGPITRAPGNGFPREGIKSLILIETGFLRQRFFRRSLQPTVQYAELWAPRFRRRSARNRRRNHERAKEAGKSAIDREFRGRADARQAIGEVKYARGQDQDTKAKGGAGDPQMSDLDPEKQGGIGGP
jgi:hypothetical protein